MNGQKTFSEAQAKPEQVLKIFQGWQRLEHNRCLDEKEILSFQTSVRDWLDSSDFLDWKSVGKGLNEFFATNFSDDEWRTVMKPEKTKDLSDVCKLISSRATLPVLHEAKYLGASCKTASAFLALRAQLQAAGVDVAKLRPSSKLDGFLRLHFQTMTNAISKLAPGRMPEIKSELHIAHRCLAWLALVSLVALVPGGVFVAPFLSATSCIILIFSFIGLFACSNFPPAKVHIEGLETFADLSRLITGEREMA